jgi:hypothetical protein
MSDDARLAAAQERFVAALVAGGEVPPGFDVRGTAATSAVLLGKRRHAVRRAVPRIPRVLGLEFAVRFDEFARATPLSAKQSPLGDAVAFLGWLKRNALLPRELRRLRIRLRWLRIRSWWRGRARA